MGIKNKINNFLKIIRKPKTIWLIFVSFITSFFGLISSQVNYAQAGIFGFLSDIGSKVVTFPIVLMGEIVSFVAGNIVILEGKILDTIVSDSLFTKLLFVQKGWAAARDIANLFFIVILIYIAFAIILRLQKGDAKKLLFKVIFIAIIINFSLMIGGMIIDASQVLFRFFVFGGLKEGVSFSTGLANSVRLQDYWSAAKENLGSDSSLNEETLSFGNQVLVRITQALTKATLMSIAALAFGALAITLVVRNIWLWVLLILAPIAWFVSIVPLGELSSLGKKWWSNFIKWVLIAPVMGFFIYLVLMMGSTKVKLINTTVESGSDVFSKQFNLSNILQFIVVIGLMVGSLMAGQSLGSSAAGSALGMVNKAKKGTQKWMGRKAANNPITRGATGWGAKQLNTLSTVPVIGKAFKGLAADANKKRDEQRKEKGKLGKEFTPDQLKGMWRNLNDQEKAEAAKKIGYDKLDAKQFEDMQKIYGRQGYEKEKKDMEKAQPLRTPEFKKNAEEYSNNEKEYSSAQKEASDSQRELEKMDKNGVPAVAPEYQAVVKKMDVAKTRAESAKANLDNSKFKMSGQFKDFDWNKTQDDLLVAFSNKTLSESEIKAMAALLADKPFKEGLGKVLPKMQEKGNWKKTAEFRRDLAVETTSHIILTDNDNLSQTIKVMGSLNSSPAAISGEYGSKGVLDKLIADKKITPEMREKIEEGMKKSKEKREKLEVIAENLAEEGLGIKTTGEGADAPHRTEAPISESETPPPSK